MSSNVKCAYCGQPTKKDNCTSYNGAFIHNIPSCNCFQAVLKKGLEVKDQGSRSR